MSKFEFKINLVDTAPSPLLAHGLLAGCIDDKRIFTKQDFRHPFGIYNVSISRVCDKLIRLCRRVENFLAVKDAFDPAPGVNGDVMEEIVDYIELLFYAAAEHVDDVEIIASCFFASSHLRDKNKSYRELQKAIKLHKKFIASATNWIKHRHSRIRLFSQEIEYGGKIQVLHGYFIEEVNAGVIGPSPAFHHAQDAFSATSLPWEILRFLFLVSTDLAKFISDNLGGINSQPVGCKALIDSVIAAARLPLYTLGESHPFETVAFNISPDPEKIALLDSGFQGSILTGWPKFGAPVTLRSATHFLGDGISRKFKFVALKQLKFQHWN
jgi:hypothetical protein